jgi:hypothetical protein
MSTPRPARAVLYVIREIDTSVPYRRTPVPVFMPRLPRQTDNEAHDLTRVGPRLALSACAVR